MEVHVNANCVGCGLCPNLAPSVFLMTREGVAAAKDAIYPEEEALCREAAESCPAGAIEIKSEG